MKSVKESLCNFFQVPLRMKNVYRWVKEGEIYLLAVVYYIFFFFSFLLLRFCIKYFSISFRWFSFFLRPEENHSAEYEICFPFFTFRRVWLERARMNSTKKTNNHKRKLISYQIEKKRVQKEFNSQFQKEIKTVSPWYSWFLLAFCVIFHPSSLFK